MKSPRKPSSKSRLTYWSNPGIRTFWQKVNTGSCPMVSFFLCRQAGSRGDHCWSNSNTGLHPRRLTEPSESFPFYSKIEDIIHSMNAY